MYWQVNIEKMLSANKASPSASSGSWTAWEGFGFVQNAYDMPLNNHVEFGWLVKQNGEHYIDMSFSKRKATFDE